MVGKRVDQFLAIGMTWGLLSCTGMFQPVMDYGQPVVVITFDDGHESVYSVGYTRMRETNPGWAATHFLPVTFIDTRGSVTFDQLKEMELAGWETGGHGYTHVNLSSVSPDSARKEIQASYDFLSSHNLCAESFAYPTGNYNYEVAALVGKWFNNIRTSHDFSCRDGVNRKELGYFAVKGGHAGSDIIARVEQAKSIGSPLVIIGFHAITPDSAAPPEGTYWCRESAFCEFLAYLKRQELPVLTIKDAMKILCR